MKIKDPVERWSYDFQNTFLKLEKLSEFQNSLYFRFDYSTQLQWMGSMNF